MNGGFSPCGMFSFSQEEQFPISVCRYPNLGVIGKNHSTWKGEFRNV